MKTYARTTRLATDLVYGCVANRQLAQCARGNLQYTATLMLSTMCNFVGIADVDVPRASVHTATAGRRRPTKRLGHQYINEMRGVTFDAFTDGGADSNTAEDAPGYAPIQQTTI